MQVCIRKQQTQKTENNKNTCRKNMCKTCMRSKQFQEHQTNGNRNMFSATQDFDPPMEI